MRVLSSRLTKTTVDKTEWDTKKEKKQTQLNKSGPTDSFLVIATGLHLVSMIEWLLINLFWTITLSSRYFGYFRRLGIGEAKGTRPGRSDLQLLFISLPIVRTFNTLKLFRSFKAGRISFKLGAQRYVWRRKYEHFRNLNKNRKRIKKMQQIYILRIINYCR